MNKQIRTLMHLSRLRLWLDSAIFKFRFGREINFKHTHKILPNFLLLFLYFRLNHLF